MRTSPMYRILGFSAVAALLAGCGGSQSLTGLAPQTSRGTAAQSGSDSATIRHVIVIVQQGRTFDNLFAGFPNADAPTTGLENTGVRVRLREVPLNQKPCAARSFRIAYDGGKMDGWNLLNPKHPLCPYTRVHRIDIRPYWDYARRFAVADQMFESTIWGEFTNELYLIAGTTKLAPRTFDVLDPSALPWSCYAPLGTTTSLLKNGKIELDAGPPPCFTQFPTMANLLDAAHVTWRCYFGGKGESLPSCPFGAIKYVFASGDAKLDFSEPASNVLTDLETKNLADVSWVFSPSADSDAPGTSGGPKWVASIVAATQKSSYWNDSAIIVVWSDAADGAFYDNVPPPKVSEMGLGFRVPLIVVSPYAKHGYVSHTVYQFGSILKFIEENWKLGSLGATDKTSNSISDMLQ